jgi:hypothetical protein
MWLVILGRLKEHTAELLVAELSAFEVKIDVKKLKRHKSPDVDQIPGEMIEAGCRTICSEIHKLIKSVWNEEGFPEH